MLCIDNLLRLPNNWTEMMEEFCHRSKNQRDFRIGNISDLEVLMKDKDDDGAVDSDPHLTFSLLFVGGRRRFILSSIRNDSDKRRHS